MFDIRKLRIRRRKAPDIVIDIWGDVIAASFDPPAEPKEPTEKEAYAAAVYAYEYRGAHR